MCRYLLLLHIIIQNVGEFEKTGNDIFRNVNLVLNICQLINCLLDSTYQIIFKHILGRISFSLKLKNVVKLFCLYLT
jgi:hypothetical protein